MKRLALALVIVASVAGAAAAQPSVPAAGLAAEGEGRWPDALRIYRAETERKPESAALWVRIADIEARLERADLAIEALQRAAAAAPGDAALPFRLSQAYAARGHATAALRAVEGALALQPRSPEYLRAHATLATWAGEYQAAASSYRTLRTLAPADQTLALALARVSAWSGASDAAATAYREYLSAAPADREAWLELARTEIWRGNVRLAIDALDEYAARFGADAAYARERVYVLARGGRPRQSLREMQPLLAASPDDVDLYLSRAVALAASRRHGAALDSLRSSEALRPGHDDTRSAESVVRSLLASNAGPAATFYDDSDGLRTVTLAPRFDFGFRTDTRISGGYEHTDLEARAGTGLEQRSGATSARVEEAWAGLSQRLGALVVGGRVGQARTAVAEPTTYSGFIRFAPADTFAASIERSSRIAAISPRAVSLGLTRLRHRADIEWSPALQYYIAIEGGHEDLSDGNTRWEVLVAPRRAVVRNQWLNLDLGLLAHQFGAARDVDNGYYDPRRYEYYSVVLFPYWKVSDNVGVGVTAGIGGQRDDRRSAFRLGSNVSAEATFGIYERWSLKVFGSTTNNRRLESGAFRGTSGGVTLLRRF